jgi:hypothetical protein
MKSRGGGEMGGACITSGKDEKRIQILSGNLNRRNNLEDSGVDGRIILERTLRK